MLNSMAINALHRMLTAVLALLVVGFGVYQYYATQPPDDDLFLQQQITPDVYLYVTKYKGGGATVSDIFRYYLDTKQRGDILTHLASRTPFLVANTGNARITGYGTHVNVTITGRIFSFTNADLFYAEGVAVMPVINLNATGVR